MGSEIPKREEGWSNLGLKEMGARYRMPGR